MTKGTVNLYHVVGDGIFFQDFYIETEDFIMAVSIARDILAGADTSGKRYYNTVEQHITSIHLVGDLTKEML